MYLKAYQIRYIEIFTAHTSENLTWDQLKERFDVSAAVISKALRWAKERHLFGIHDEMKLREHIIALYQQYERLNKQYLRAEKIADQNARLHKQTIKLYADIDFSDMDAKEKVQLQKAHESLISRYAKQSIIPSHFLTNVSREIRDTVTKIAEFEGLKNAMAPDSLPREIPTVYVSTVEEAQKIMSGHNGRN